MTTTKLENKQTAKTNGLKKEVKGIRGEIISFTKDPFLFPEEECVTHYPDGLLIICDGIIQEVGDYATIREHYPEKMHIDHYPDAVIMPGFVDCHVHYVQTAMVGAFGDTLLDWLNHYTFPEESRFKDKAVADEVAKVFFKAMLAQGTTTANVFATTYPASVNAFFEESERYNTRMISGKVFQNRNVPSALSDTSEEASIAQAEELLYRWHKRGRQLYAVVPRFAPTSTERQMELMGDLYQRHLADGVYLHSHLNESQAEKAWVAELFPQFASYTDVYAAYGMIDHHTVMAHTCLMNEEDWRKLYAAQCGCAHCPSSNLFLGGGQFSIAEAKSTNRPQRVGIGSDIGGGTNFSIPRQLGDAYKVGMLKQTGISAVQSFYLATRGGAATLHLEETIGTLAPGYEADIAVLDFKANEFVAWRLERAKDIWEKLFVLQTLGLDTMNRATYVAGEKVYDKYRETGAFCYAHEI